MEKLQAVLTAKLNNYSNSDGKWIQFIKDHYAYLMRNSNRFTLSTEDQQLYRFRLYEYLSSITDLSMECHWIVTWLNGLTSNQDFDGVSSLIIPTKTTLDTLRDMYITQSSHASIDETTKRWN